MRIFVRFDIFEILFFKELFRVFAVKKTKEKNSKKNRSFWSRGHRIWEKKRDTLQCSSAALEKRAFQNDFDAFLFRAKFFLSFFLSLKNGISRAKGFSLLVLRAFRRALRRREKEHGDGKIIVLVYRDLDGDHSSGVSFNRGGLQPERFEMRQEMGRGTVVWVTFTTI